MSNLAKHLSDNAESLLPKQTPSSPLKDIHYFRQILEYSLDMICTTNIKGCFVSMSPAVEKILGYRVDEIVGMEFIKFVHPEDEEETIAEATKVMEGKPVTNFVNRYRKKDGGYAYISWSSIWSEENQLIYGIAKDVTEAKLRDLKDRENEKKIAQSEYFLNEVGRIARVGGWEFDATTLNSTWSPAVYDIYELPYDHNPNLTDSLNYYKGAHKELVKKVIEEARNENKKWDIELEVTTAKGNLIWIRSFGEPVYHNGVLIKMRGVLMDVTKYRVNETALNRSLDLLNQHNKQLNGFTHILSHNLRNHANNISMLTSFIDTDTLDKGNAELFAKLEKVSKNLTGTLNDLSNAIKIRERVIEPDLIDLEKATQDVMGLLDADLKYHAAQVNTDYAVPEVSFPQIYMESILTNLLSNSIKYKREGRPPEILISTYLDDTEGCVVMEYQDNGIGIDLSQHGENVFGLYKTFSPRADAHGVGLFLVKTQVESQGGNITISSRPGVGTAFRIFFKKEA